MSRRLISSGSPRDYGDSRAVVDGDTASADGTEAVTGSITDVSKGAEETGGAVEQVLGAGVDMVCKSEQLSAEIHRFRDGIRAA